jgi:hypothetical protein
MDKENGNRKRSAKGNTREQIRRRRHEQKRDNEEVKGEGIILECSEFKKRRRRILRLRETI